MKYKKCCWSECRKKAVCGLATNDSKGFLEMCEECNLKYRKHSDLREKGFMKDAIGIVRKKLKGVDKDIEEMWNPELKYCSKPKGRSP